MSLEVWTARMFTLDPDRFDVTRKSGGAAGVIFAPSWTILRPALAARKEAKRLRDEEGDQFWAFETEEETWRQYVPAFLAEMRTSLRAHQPAWEALLVRPRVVLACYCVDRERCHRTLLARDILPTLGATYRGEATP